MKQVSLRVSVLFLFTTLLFSASVSAQVTGSIFSQTNVTCFGSNNGSVTVTQSGGTGPFSYSWSPTGGTNATANGLYIYDLTGQVVGVISEGENFAAGKTFTYSVA